jgi:hypothetical protein
MGSVFLLLLTATELDPEPGPKPGVEPGVKPGSGFHTRSTSCSDSSPERPLMTLQAHKELVPI